MGRVLTRPSTGLPRRRQLKPLVLVRWCSFPRGPSKYPILEMELTKFHKLVRDLDLFGPNLSTLDLDLILLKCRPRVSHRSPDGTFCTACGHTGVPGAGK